MARGKGWLIGGRGDKGVDIFDPKARKWTKGPAMPTQMHHMQCVVYKGNVYIATSWFGPSPREQNNDKLWILNTKTERWTSKAGLPARRRRGGAAAVLRNKKIYVVGGNRGGHGAHSKTLGWMDCYDIEKDKWKTGLPNLPEGRDHVGGVLVKGMLCIAGGRNGGKKDFFGATIKSTYCYNFEKKKWVNMKAPIPKGRAGAAYGKTCDGKMMIVGGEGKFSKAFDRADLFDGKKWTSGPALQRERHGTGLAVAKCKCGQIFIASGSGARGGRPELQSTEVYLPNGRDVKCQSY